MTENNTRKKLGYNTASQIQVDGKMPPQAIDFEEAVLGACLLEKDALNDVIDILKPESFYKYAHLIVFESIKRLYSSNEPVNIMTVVMDLKKTEQLEIVGGAYFISQLTSRVSSSENIEYHARIVQQQYVLREIIRKSSEMINKAYGSDADCFELLAEWDKSLTDITGSVSSNRIKKISNIWDDTREQNDLMLKNKGVSGVPTGYTELNKITGGWQNSELIIIAARPAMGKTSLALNLARNASVDYNIPSLVFSLEMSSLRLGQRLFSMESSISNSEFIKTGLEKDKMIVIESDCKRLINSNLFIDDTPSMTITEIKAKARKMKRDHGIGLIVVDYLQLMSGDKGVRGNREQEIATISRGLKILAKELDVPIIALSQLSRAVESRGGEKRPMLSDLRESGAIEQDADIVVFIHRPEYYGITEDGQGNSLVGVAEIIFAKNRNGGIGAKNLKWIDNLTKFENIYEPSSSNAIRSNIDFTQPNRQEIPF